MAVLSLILFGTALGGFIAALAIHRPGQQPRKRDQSRAHGKGKPTLEGGDARLLRELQDDVELRLRKLSKLLPGEHRREEVRLLRRQYSRYKKNERLHGLLDKLCADLERRTEPLLGDAPAALPSPAPSCYSMA